MAVRIRLKRMGRKKQPHYRVVVAESSAPRDGRFVESVGYFKPLSSPARLVLDLERVEYWLGQGASPSNTVKSLISRARAGGDTTVAVGEPDLEAQKKKAQEALAAKRSAEKKKVAAAAEAEAAAAAEAEAAAAAEAETAAAAEAEAAAAAEAETAAAPGTVAGAEVPGEAPQGSADEADEVSHAEAEAEEAEGDPEAGAAR
jgi:small subunit ribosomal protein S16